MSSSILEHGATYCIKDCNQRGTLTSLWSLMRTGLNQVSGKCLNTGWRQDAKLKIIWLELSWRLRWGAYKCWERMLAWKWLAGCISNRRNGAKNKLFSGVGGLKSVREATFSSSESIKGKPSLNVVSKRCSSSSSILMSWEARWSQGLRISRRT